MKQRKEAFSSLSDSDERGTESKVNNLITIQDYEPSIHPASQLVSHLGLMDTILMLVAGSRLVPWQGQKFVFVKKKKEKRNKN